MEIINQAWLSEIYNLVKARMESLDAALERAKEDEGKDVHPTDCGYVWYNHMGLPKRHSNVGMAAMREFVQLYERGSLNVPLWEELVSTRMWVEIAMALYFCNDNLVFAGVTFVDVRDFIFRKIVVTD